MKGILLYKHLNTLAARILNPLQGLFAAGARFYVGWQFLKSGWLKATSFENTLFLFAEEYRVPLLPSDLAAVLGTAGEIGFSALLILGICGRLSALGLFAVNVMAVVSYAHVLLSEGFEAALGQHYLWGFMLAMLVIYGPGVISIDNWLARGAPREPSGIRLQAV